MSDTDSNIPSGPVSAASADAPGVTSALMGPSWQEQDVVLRDLWLQNKTPQQIAADLGRSVAAIMTRAARLGLPRRSAPGRKPGTLRAPLQPGEAAPVSRPRPATRAGLRGETVQTSTRICLMCLRAFQSLGRHNRICPSCKGSAEYESAVALAEINFPV